MKITSVIDNLDEATADRLAELARLGRNRFEVVLDRVDGDHTGLELHFRLTEITATSQMRPRPEPRVMHVGSGSGTGPEFAMFEPDRRPADPAKLARVIAELLRQRVITPAMIGMPLRPGDEAGWNAQVEEWLRS